MNSKTDKMSNAIENIESIVNYYLNELDKKYSSGQISKKEYTDTFNRLDDIKKIVSSLNFDSPFYDEKLDYIRMIGLTIMNLLEEGDYNYLYYEISKTNNDLCKYIKEMDRKKLSEFKKSYNGLSDYYKKRLSKMEKTDSGTLQFQKKNDNVKFLLEKYLSVKYNFKKLKYETASISDENKQIIDECNRIIESNQENEVIKNNYSIVKNYIEKYATSEVIVYNLEMINRLCDSKEYQNIKEKALELINKYQKIYNDNSQKYNVLFSQENVVESTLSR